MQILWFGLSWIFSASGEKDISAFAASQLNRRGDIGVQLA